MPSELFLYDRFLDDRLSANEPDWDDAAAGAFMFILADNTYTPLLSHSTTSDITGVIASGDGAPINVSARSIDGGDASGDNWLNSGNADFGQAVTIAAKYLICVAPVSAGTYNASTSRLAFYVDLDTSGASVEVSVVGTGFRVDTPANGWMNFKKQ